MRSIDKTVIRTINKNPMLLSLLYDMDLLPEQLKKGSAKWHYMTLFVCGFIAGQKSLIASWQHNPKQ